MVWRAEENQRRIDAKESGRAFGKGKQAREIC